MIVFLDTMEQKKLPLQLLTLSSFGTLAMGPRGVTA